MLVYKQTCFSAYFRPRFRAQDRHPVPVGPEVQDHRADPDRHRHHRAEDVEGAHTWSAVAGPVRFDGHLQVHQAQGCRGGNPALPLGGACSPPRRIRSRQGVQRATARPVIDQPRSNELIIIIIFLILFLVCCC